MMGKSYYVAPTYISTISAKHWKHPFPRESMGKLHLLGNMKNTLSKENQNSNTKVEQLSSLLLSYRTETTSAWNGIQMNMFFC